MYGAATGWTSLMRKRAFGFTGDPLRWPILTNNANERCLFLGYEQHDQSFSHGRTLACVAGDLDDLCAALTAAQQPLPSLPAKMNFRSSLTNGVRPGASPPTITSV